MKCPPVRALHFANWSVIACALVACDQRVESRHGVAPVSGGVVLLDTGENEEGRLLRSLLGSRPVVAVLVTHAHHDHHPAAAQLAVPVYVGADDIPRMEGKTLHQGAIQAQYGPRTAASTCALPCPQT